MTKLTLQATYKNLLQTHRLAPNPHQATLVTRLAGLQTTLLQTNHASTAPPVPGLYIYGSVGTGKSQIADLFTATLPPEISRRRMHFHAFMNDIHSRLHARSTTTTTTSSSSSSSSSPSSPSSFPSPSAVDPLLAMGKAIRSEARVLCLDEFQVTDIADAMILARLFEGLWSAGGVLVSTSNRPPSGLYENGLNRDVVVPFIEKVQRRCEVWRMGGEEDYRMRDGGGEGEGEEEGRQQTFVTRLDEFCSKLQEALGDATLERFSIPVYGSRTLEISAVPRRRDDGGGGNSGRRFDLVSGTFPQFCEAPRASSDYHALCSSTPTLFLSGLRQFAVGERDCVRRFITLIDIAYEMKTRVVCHATVPLGVVFAHIVPVKGEVTDGLGERVMTVRGAGGASSSMMSTFIGETEWSATGLAEASLATGGAGETDVGFAVGRAISRLYEMGSERYGVGD